MRRNPIVLLLMSVIMIFAACDGSDRQWDTGREALDGLTSDLDQANQRWDLYRDEIVQGLDLMKEALASARSEGSIVDRTEIDALGGQVEALRQEMASHVDVPSDTDRIRLRGTFEAIRTHVDSLLNRLGHDPDEIARWQDES